MPQFSLPSFIRLSPRSSFARSSFARPSFAHSAFAVRAGAAVLVTAVLTLVSGAAAQAHVQVIPDATAAGTEITKLTFRVPTESATAATTKVSIGLPTATPFAEVLAEPIAGWTVSVTEGKLPKPVVLDGTTLTKAPVSVTWTATKGYGVGPGEFQEFALSAGPIPTDATTLSFPATQTYSDGTVVKWDEPQPAGADEPEHPLPSFTVTAAIPADGATTSATAPPSAPAGPTAGTAGDPAKATATDSTARALGTGGLLAGLLGLVLGALAWRRSVGSPGSAA